MTEESTEGENMLQCSRQSCWVSSNTWRQLWK